MEKGAKVSFVVRGTRVSGTVVRVKKSGLTTVDVPDMDMWYDVSPSLLTVDTKQPGR